MMKGPSMDLNYGTIGEMNDPRPVDENEFAEFMWMGEELEEFDQQVEQQLMEEFLIETCVEQMLRDEDEVENIPPELQMCFNVNGQNPQPVNGFADGRDVNRATHDGDAGALAAQVAQMDISNRPKASVDVSVSRLNPNAPAFVFNPNASVFVPRAAPGLSQTKETEDTKLRDSEVAAVEGSSKEIKEYSESVDSKKSDAEAKEEKTSAERESTVEKLESEEAEKPLSS